MVFNYHILWHRKKHYYLEGNWAGDKHSNYVSIARQASPCRVARDLSYGQMKPCSSAWGSGEINEQGRARLSQQHLTETVNIFCRFDRSPIHKVKAFFFFYNITRIIQSALVLKSTLGIFIVELPTYVHVRHCQVTLRFFKFQAIFKTFDPCLSLTSPSFVVLIQILVLC